MLVQGPQQDHLIPKDVLAPEVSPVLIGSSVPLIFFTRESWPLQTTNINQKSYSELVKVFATSVQMRVTNSLILPGTKKNKIPESWTLANQDSPRQIKMSWLSKGRQGVDRRLDIPKCSYILQGSHNGLIYSRTEFHSVSKT